jgi:F1F0 ATPase subunit 2
MTINETLTALGAFLAGGGLGIFFFGGLWWTIRKGIASPQPVLWFCGSLLLRMSVALGGFYLVSGGDWRRLAACLVGFVTARMSVAWFTRSKSKSSGGRPCVLLPTS